MATVPTSLATILRQQQRPVLESWTAHQLNSLASRRDLISEADLRRQSQDFLDAYLAAEDGGEMEKGAGPAYDRLVHVLEGISALRAQSGFSPAETATFVFSLKQPLFELIRKAYANPEDVIRETWRSTVTLHRLGLLTTTLHQKTREKIIVEQQAMLELSTPVVTLWKGILALPLIGTFDSERTQIVMETLLQRIVETGAGIAILDITGVPTVDTLVAQHLLKTVAAARLMGADCIISGIRPQIAQTIVHLGVDLNSVVTKGTLAEAFAVAMKRTGLAIVSVAARPASASIASNPPSSTPEA
jgi:rsbT co-antagonist protein RsbR